MRFHPAPARFGWADGVRLGQRRLALELIRERRREGRETSEAAGQSRDEGVSGSQGTGPRLDPPDLCYSAS